MLHAMCVLNDQLIEIRMDFQLLDFQILLTVLLGYFAAGFIDALIAIWVVIVYLIGVWYLRACGQ